MKLNLIDYLVLALVWLGMIAIGVACYVGLSMTLPTIPEVLK